MIASLVVAALLPTKRRAAASEVPTSDETTFAACFEDVRERLRRSEGVAVVPAIEACAELAYEDAERWRIGLARALAHQQSGERLMAHARFEAFLTASVASRDPEWIARRAEVVRVVAALEDQILATHARLVAAASPTEARARVTRGADEVVYEGPAPWTAFVTPGTYRVVLAAEAHVAFETVVNVAAGMRQTIQTALEPEPAVIIEPAPIVATPPDRTAAWVVGAVGVAALIGGGVFTGLALDDAGRLEELQRTTPTEALVAEDRRVRRRLDARETTSWVGYGVAAGALVAAALLWVTAAPGEARVTPLSGGPGAALSLSF